MGGAPHRRRLPAQMRGVRPSDYVSQKSGGKEDSEGFSGNFIKNSGFIREKAGQTLENTGNVW